MTNFIFRFYSIGFYFLREAKNDSSDIGIHFKFYLFLSLKAEEERFDPFSSSLANAQHLLPTTIQSVSVISGEWLESETDFIVKGPDPLVLSRSYSADYHAGRLGYNWEFNRPHSLIVEKSHDVERGKVHFKARLHHPSGIKTIHALDDVKHALCVLPLACTRALTNCHSTEISGRTNLHNVLLKIHDDHHTGQAITGSGHVIHYRLQHESLRGTQYFFPDYEKMTSGNLLLFQEQKIVSTNAKRSTQYGYLTFKPESEKKMVIQSNDGRLATYTFDCYPQAKTSQDHRKPDSQSKRYCLTRVEYSHQPQIEYEYDYPSITKPTERPPNPLLKKKKWRQHRFQEVTYYREGKNIVDRLGEIRIAKNDFRHHRVKEIKAPVGHDETPIVTHRLIYLADDPSSAGKDKSFSGKTEVYDAYLNKTVYVYNKEHRPMAISRYLANGELYSREKFIWDEEDPAIDFQRIFCDAALQEKEGEPLDVMAEMGERETNPAVTASYQQPLKQATHRPEIIHKLLQHQASKGSARAGNLMGKYLQGKDGKIQHALFFAYDSRGNIVKESYYGHLTGTISIPIELDRFKMP